MKDGKPVPTVEERQAEDKKKRDEDFKIKMQEYEKKQKEDSFKFEEYCKRQESLDEKIVDERKKIENVTNTTKDKIILASISLFWLGMVFYSNYSNYFGSKL